MRDKKTIRVLVAAAPRSVNAIADALQGHFDLAFSDSMANAKSALGAGTDVVVCGLDFDESRMFDLLRYAKADPETRGIQFVSVNAIDGIINHTFEQSIEIACMALGAAQFVELTQWRRTYGMDEAHLRFRQLIERLTAHQ